MVPKKIFLASSSELKPDREQFEIFINRKNKDWIYKGVFLELIVWEDFLDAVSQTRLQDEYNKAIRECDIFVMLFFTKVGKYTEEEFETAFGQFKTTNKPFIFTYFKDTEISVGSANKKDLMSLWAFQEKLNTLGHFYTVYKNIDELKFKFDQQLDKLAVRIFIDRLRYRPLIFGGSSAGEMCKKYDFFDTIWNKNSTGFNSKFKPECKSNVFVIIDEATSLMWEQSGSHTPMLLEDAEEWIEKLNNISQGGYNDWRMPTLEEAMTLMRPCQKDNRLYIDPIFDKQQKWIWTSDKWIEAKIEERAIGWVVNFYGGSCSYPDGVEKRYVRAVRSIDPP